MRALSPRPASTRRGEENERSRWIAITVSIITSVLLWFSFTMTETYSVTLQLPTVVENLPSQQALVALPPQGVRVQFQGEGFQIFRMRYNPPVVRLNAALDEVSVRDAISELPKGVMVQSVRPEIIRLRKGPRVSRRIPVQIRATIDMPPTHDLLDSLRVIPDSITVWGTREVISSLRYWPTEPFAFQGLKDSLRVNVNLADTLGGLVAISRRGVTLVGVAREFTEGTRELDVTVRGLPGADEIVSLKPPTVRVRYRVLFSDYFRAQRAPDFYAEVHYDALRSDTTGFIRPIVHVPPDLVIRDVEVIPPTLAYYWRVGE